MLMQVWSRFLRRLVNLKSQSNRRGSFPRHRNRLVRRGEQLEVRQLLTATAWTGSGDGSNWGDPQNWSTGAVPGSSDDVTINLLGSQTIVYSSYANTTINSLNGSDDLSITNGAMTITGNSTLTGGLSISNGANLVADGSGVAISATGATTLDAASLTVVGGASLTLTGAITATNENRYINNAFYSSGAGSVLSLPAMTGLGRFDANLYVEALAGGTVSMPVLATVNNGSSPYIHFFADGAGSTLDISGLTSFTGLYGYAALSDTNQATVLDAQLATMDGVDVTLDGTGTISVNQITSITNANSGAGINITGGTSSSVD